MNCDTLALKDKSTEIQRLIDAFDTEAAKFHDLEFHTYHISQGAGPILTRKFRQPNHAIMLWQYYGPLDSDAEAENFVANLRYTNTQWDVRGAVITFMGVLEGALFVRMAARAGSLFDREEADYIKSRVVSELQSKETKKRPMSAVNENPVAVWLNYLLYHLSLSSPGRDRAHRIEPDAFSLSLLALERLATEQAIVKSDRSTRDISQLQFRVAVSFPGEKRRYASRVVDVLRKALGADCIFYDFDYQAQLARPNLDTLLQNIYRQQSELVVVFLCAEYVKKDWCGLKWRAVRDIIKSRDDSSVMFVRFDDAEIEGVFSIDGYIDGNRNTTKQVADFVLERIH